MNEQKLHDYADFEAKNAVKIFNLKYLGAKIYIILKTVRNLNFDYFIRKQLMEYLIKHFKNLSSNLVKILNVN